jgi:hypothetical protein
MPTIDLTISRDYASWVVHAHTLRGRAVLEALSIADGTKLDTASHLSLLEAAQRAGLEVNT